MTTEPEQRTTRSADGVEIAFDVAGAGEPALVFVHGWAGIGGHWEGQVEAFSPDHLVVRMDLAGHGRSGADRTRWSVSAFADDVVAVVDALSLDRVVLIGHSLGGSIVVAAAQRLGRRVVGLVGVDTWSSVGVRAPAGDAGSSVLLPEMRADFAAGSARFAELMCGPSSPVELVERVKRDVGGMAPEIAVAVLEDAIQLGPDELESGLRALDVPKSAISSESFRPKDADVLADFGICQVVVAGTGHYLMLERPDEFNRELTVAIGRTGG